MSGDIYPAADDLVVRLRADGADHLADAVNHAIDAGSTGTEILMALRQQLEQVLKADEPSSQAKQLAKELRTEIDELLKG